MQGMLVARQYFDGKDTVEIEIRDRITRMWEEVEWDWFLNGTDTLYWHWSPNHEWTMNMPIVGYHEGLITYLLAIASPTHAIAPSTYYDGWTSGNYAYGKEDYGHRQWVGSDWVGPCSSPTTRSWPWTHVNGETTTATTSTIAATSPSSIKPTPLQTQPGTKATGSRLWGLTASVNPWGYDAHSPTNDNGTITPDGRTEFDSIHPGRILPRHAALLR